MALHNKNLTAPHRDRSQFTASSASSPSISPPRNILPLILSTPHSHFLVVASAAAATRFRCHLPLATKLLG
ncbi:hypothetical protein SDJN03_03735, partial [Cucurbita argyrosperma subsp. sororia]